MTMSFSGKAYRILVDLIYEHSRIRLGADKQTLLANWHLSQRRAPTSLCRCQKQETSDCLPI